MSVVAYMLASDVHSCATVPNGKICNENHSTKKGPTTIALQCDTPWKRERSKIQPIWLVLSWTWQLPSTPTQGTVSNKIWTLQDMEFIQLTDWRQTEEVVNEVIAWLVLGDLSTVRVVEGISSCCCVRSLIIFTKSRQWSFWSANWFPVRMLIYCLIKIQNNIILPIIFYFFKRPLLMRYCIIILFQFFIQYVLHLFSPQL